MSEGDFGPFELCSRTKSSVFKSFSWLEARGWLYMSLAGQALEAREGRDPFDRPQGRLPYPERLRRGSGPCEVQGLASPAVALRESRHAKRLVELRSSKWLRWP